ncbi:MAG: cell shape determination protein CcmA [Acidobacteria bacterium]|jgi:cytoskeletal protein CcmA (bactofilin family)|nr:MAG: cell shape determination protein CcmA [Acidobacteriota bacterium]PYV86530.1 MAG: cell shape determination protein CcmA [Acidobacteriota bacterium]
MDPNRTTEAARIGKTLVIKGELSGNEDLYIDGRIEGKIELQKNSLVVGPNGKVQAGVNAGKIVIHGTLDGDLRAADRVELKKTGMVTGDIIAQRIAIEDGAYFKGKVEIQRDAASKPEAARAANAAQTQTTAQAADSALTKA